MTDVAVLLGVGDMGVAIARRVGAGRRLLLADRNPELCAARVAEFADAGFDVAAVDLDVASGDSVAALAEQAAAHGAVRTVIHTAGVSPVNGTVESILAVDLVGTAFVLEAFGEVIAAGGSGVVIASMAAAMFPALEADFDRALATTPAADLGAYATSRLDQFPNPGHAYAFAKQANIARVAAAAKSWGARGATINAISPGVIATAMGRAELASENGEVMRMLVDGSATRRLGTPEDIATAAEFLLSPAASFITGTNLLVDGGVCASIRFGG
jgi:NAD(P)-dependent dehydrogenase (short-subunit alcohol dehydrogenase family)